MVWLYEVTKKESILLFCSKLFFSALKIYGVTISSTILVADSADALTNGFKEVFTMSKRVNCWAHVKRNIDKRIGLFSKELKAVITKDIQLIQDLFDPNLFETSVELFENKWKSKKVKEIDDFVNYFVNEWSIKNNGWYESYCKDQMLPSTTNGLESSHEKIRSGLRGRRLGLLEFLNEFRENMIKFWSIIRSDTIEATNPDTNEQLEFDNINIKEFHNEPVYSNRDMQYGKT